MQCVLTVEDKSFRQGLGMLASTIYPSTHYVTSSYPTSSVIAISPLKKQKPSVMGMVIFSTVFFNKQGKWFSAYLTRTENGNVELSSIIGKCPVCGQDVLVGPTAFNCSNYRHGCDFKIWRHYYGHKVNLQDAKELLGHGKLKMPFEAFDKLGHVHALTLKVGLHNEIQVTSYK